MSSTRALPVLNEVLRDKYDRYFDCLDVNKDGVWDKADFEIIEANVLKNTAHLDPGKQEDIAKLMTEFWAAIPTDKLDVTKEEFWKLADIMLQNPPCLEKVILGYHNRVFDCMDTNGDGMVDFEEYRKFRSYEGVTDVATVRKLFNVLDRNKDKLISRDEYISAYLTYFLDRTVGADYLPLFN